MASGLTNRRFSRIDPGEQLRVLRDEADPLAQAVEVHRVVRVPVVENPPVLRAVQADQQLHERRLARARRADEGDRLAALDLERDVRQRGRRAP